MTQRVPKAAALRSGLAAIAFGAVMALAACGDDSGDDESAADSTATAEVADSGGCAESFSSGADGTQAGIVRLSHAEDGEIIAGTYTGEPFEAETYDEQLDGDGTMTSVDTGNCVVTEVSPVYGPLYLFVESEDEWHRLLENDARVPLVPDPEPQLDNVEMIQIESIPE